MRDPRLGKDWPKSTKWIKMHDFGWSAGWIWPQTDKVGGCLLAVYMIDGSTATEKTDWEATHAHRFLIECERGSSLPLIVNDKPRRVIWIVGDVIDPDNEYLCDMSKFINEDNILLSWTNLPRVDQKFKYQEINRSWRTHFVIAQPKHHRDISKIRKVRLAMRAFVPTPYNSFPDGTYRQQLNRSMQSQKDMDLL